ncbi:hypothetical protein N480_00575 [Pseudoalteromonas luteoviolacea S2607]|uniref:hypothetical protein n=1 Tax=Pseudoalteromonas luteoviolacea TaxID=43657 RepID=UPI0007B0A99A|nr:hypothetical protein [Pseudoalteromonas luteoviolacea]KZN39356.1 hypothetical protein N480_00575 [Pseudoalteromonas luteoviolacea S2607]
MLLSDLTEIMYHWDLSIGLVHCLEIKGANTTIVINNLHKIEAELNELFQSLNDCALPSNLLDTIEENLMGDTVLLWSRNSQ